MNGFETRVKVPSGMNVVLFEPFLDGKAQFFRGKNGRAIGTIPPLQIRVHQTDRIEVIQLLKIGGVDGTSFG